MSTPTTDRPDPLNAAVVAYETSIRARGGHACSVDAIALTQAIAAHDAARSSDTAGVANPGAAILACNTIEFRNRKDVNGALAGS